MLADQRVREQRLVRDGRVAADGRLRGEPLIGGDVLHKAEQLRRDRWLRQRLGAAGTDLGQHLDDVVVGKALDGPVVADVDDVRLPGVRGERTDEPDRGLAVERAAALLEERWLFDESWIAVKVEQLAL